MTDERDAAHAGQVQFYNDEASLSRLVAGFLAEGFANGDPAIVVATPEHSAAIEAALRQRSVDVDTLNLLSKGVLSTGGRAAVRLNAKFREIT